MALLTQFATNTVSNTNLTTATLVATITNSVRIRKLYVNIFADQVKGSGDYVAYITIQRVGAGSFYEAIKTTKTLGAGITSAYWGSIPITLNATDVMKVYVTGLSTDNDTTADVIVDCNEEWFDDTGAGFTSVPNSAGVGTLLTRIAQTIEFASVSGHQFIKSDLDSVLATLLTETNAHQLANAFIKLLDVTTPVLTAASVNQGGDAYAQIGVAGANLTALPIPDGIIEGTLTFKQMFRLILAILANRSAGGGTTTLTFQDLAHSKARITATVNAAGDRTDVTIDGT